MERPRAADGQACTLIFKKENRILRNPEIDE
jgi:hypothetical protein